MTFATVISLILVGALFGSVLGFTVAWIGFTTVIAGEALDEKGNDEHEQHHC